MGFVGSVNQEIRNVLAELAPKWAGRPVYVGCSGNFTVERCLSQLGVKELHGSDVSLYSCLVGTYLATGQIDTLGVKIVDPDFAWLGDTMTTPLDAIATLLICSTSLPSAQRKEPFHVRIWGAYQKQWKRIHTQTVEKSKKALDGIHLKSFAARDVMEFVDDVPEGAVMVSFPPTYKGGYERLYKKIDAIFAWERPAYKMFDATSFEAFLEKVMAKTTWCTLRDEPVEALAPFEVASVQTSLRSKAVHVYTNTGTTVRVVLPKLANLPVNIPRVGAPKGATSLRLIRLLGGQVNTLRAEYLAPGITPSSGQLNLGVLLDDEIAGVLVMSKPTFGGWCDAYMMSGFAVRPTEYKRLAKLVLVAALSTETQAELQRLLNGRVRVIGTTAFSEKAMSMKYRGLLDLHSRKEGILNYTGQAGRWTLAEGLELWKRKHEKLGRETTSSDDSET